MIQQDYEQLHERKEHSDRFFPYNTYICTIPLDFTRVSPHWHDDVEFIVVKAGQGIVNVDMNSYYVAEGDIIVVRPGQIHSIYQEGLHRMEYENIIFKTQLLYSATSDLYTIQFFERYFDLQYELPMHISAVHKSRKELCRCIEEIDRYCEEMPLNYQMMVKSDLYQFFHLITLGQEDVTVSNNSKNLGKIKQVIAYVEAHYMEEITIEVMAKELGFSASHFMKFFKKNMHVTFTEYLNDYRLDKASELLKSSEDTMVAIMEQVGFNNLSYFNRLFKAYFLMTPREFRRK